MASPRREPGLLNPGRAKEAVIIPAMPWPDRPLRLLLFSPALPPAAAGNARQAARLKKSLRDRGVRVRLVAAGLPPARQLALARRFRPGLLWGLHLGKSGPAVFALAKKLRVPYGLTVTGTDVNEAPLRAPARQRAALAAAAALVIPDESFRAPLRKRLRVWKTELPAIVCIPPAFALPAGLRRAPGPRPPVILWLGGLRAVKAPGWALAAFAEVRKKIPAAQFCFAGPILERTAAAPVLRAARDPASGVRYLGPKSWRAAQRLIAGAAVVTNTSRSEALPHALGEALQLGVPVVARAIAGNRPFLRPYGPGFAVVSPAGWRRQMLRLLRNPPARVSVARSGSRSAPSREAREYAALLRTLLHAPADG